MKTPYRLHYAPDNASLVIRLVLEEMALPYETTLVDRARKEQEGAAYRALNPNGLIPVLVTPQGPIFETAAILLWLADTHGRMAPRSDSPERAAFLKWLFFLSNTLSKSKQKRKRKSSERPSSCLETGAGSGVRMGRGNACTGHETL